MDNVWLMIVTNVLKTVYIIVVVRVPTRNIMANVLLAIIVSTAQHLEEQVHARLSLIAVQDVHQEKQVVMAQHFVVIMLQTIALLIRVVMGNITKMAVLQDVVQMAVQQGIVAQDVLWVSNVFLVGLIVVVNHVKHKAYVKEPMESVIQLHQQPENLAVSVQVIVLVNPQEHVVMGAQEIGQTIVIYVTGAIVIQPSAAM